VVSSLKEQIRHQISDLSLPNMWMSMCMTKDGRQWGEQKDIEMLTALGVAAGIIEEIARNPEDPTLRAFDYVEVA